MTSSVTILDADILSAIMRRDARLAGRPNDYLAMHGKFTLSIITQYEVLRGLRAKGAHRQEANFRRFCDYSVIVPLNDQIVDQAADIYSQLKRQGRLIDDADILVSATAKVHGWTVVTNNEAHFSRVSGLPLVNWLRD